ncbi:MAG: acyl carrier protein [Acidobacteriia bacterium]|nr:acyl carrier protein [Terriglobia bacterium]
MNTDMAEDTVIEILRNALQVDGDFAPSDAMRLEEIPNLDSMARVRMVLEIERVLDDRLSMEEIIAIESVGHIRELLAAKGKPLAEG